MKHDHSYSVRCAAPASVAVPMRFTTAYETLRMACDISARGHDPIINKDGQSFTLAEFVRSFPFLSAGDILSIERNYSLVGEPDGLSR